MKVKTNKKQNHNNNKHKNVKSKLNKINKNHKNLNNLSKLRKYKTKSFLKGGSMNPLKIISFYFYKLISKAVLLNKEVSSQLNILLKNMPKKTKDACEGKNLKNELINICIKIFQSMSVVGFFI